MSKSSETQSGGQLDSLTGTGDPSTEPLSGILDSAHTQSAFDTTAPEHVVLVSVDALRADHLGCHGYHRDTSPTIDAFAAAGTRFSRAHSPSSHTREAVPSLLSGQYPSVATTDGFRRDTPTIGKLLQGTTARSAGIHSNPFVSEGFGFADGFDHFDDDMFIGSHWLTALAQRALDKVRNRHYARAETITDRGLSFLESQAVDGSRSTFTWLHYMDVHGPYEPPEQFRKRYGADPISSRDAAKLYKQAIKRPESITADQRQQLIDLYDAELRYFDASFRQLLTGLQRLGIADETLILLTADHGEAFGEHGYYEHPRQLPHELTHVPLIAAGAGVGSQHVVETPVSTMDVVPTVASVFDVSYDGPAISLSQTVDNPNADRVVFAQARGEGEATGTQRYAAYQLGGTAHAKVDSETGDCTIESGARQALAGSLREHVGSHGYRNQGSTDERRAESGHGSEENDVEHRLRALGYVEE